MSKLSTLVVLAAIAAGGAYCYMNYQFKVKRDKDGRLECVMITPRDAAEGSAGSGQPLQNASVRIGTFNLGGLDEKKLARRPIADVLTRLLPQFDIVALQDIRARNQGVLVRLVEQINAATGRTYRSVAGGDFGHDPAGRYGAFLFDTSRIAIDHALANPVDDPAKLFRHKPLVASFRVLGPEKTMAFTFKLVNVHTDPDRAAAELDRLADVFRAVRQDGSNEDDVIILGQFAADEKHLGRLGKLLDITSAIAEVPTTLRASGPVDNILFDRRATSEYRGRAGVMDLMREFDLTMREALEVSDHLPVWAEFSSYEGGQYGHTAGRGHRATR